MHTYKYLFWNIHRIHTNSYSFYQFDMYAILITNKQKIAMKSEKVTIIIKHKITLIKVLGGASVV